MTINGSYPPIYRPAKLDFSTSETAFIRRRPRVSLTSLKVLAVVILFLLVCTATGTALLLVRSFGTQTTKTSISVAASSVDNTACGCATSLLLRSDTRLPSTNVTVAAGRHLDNILDSVLLNLHLRALAQLIVKAATQFNQNAAWSHLKVQEKQMARQLQPGIIPSSRERHVDKEEDGALSLLFLNRQFLTTLEDDLRLLMSLTQLLSLSDGEGHRKTKAESDSRRSESTLADAVCQVNCLRRQLFPVDDNDKRSDSSRTSVQSRLTKWQNYLVSKAHVRDSDSLQWFLVSRDAVDLLQHYADVCTAFYRLDLEVSLRRWAKRLSKREQKSGGRSNNLVSTALPKPMKSST